MPLIRLGAAFRSLDAAAWAEALRPFGIQVSAIDGARRGDEQQLPALVLIEAVEGPHDSVPVPGWRSTGQWIAGLSARGVGTVVVAAQWRNGLVKHLHDGASGILLADSTDAQKAATLWSIYRQCLKLHELAAELRKRERLQLVHQAAALVAQSIGVSQEEAVRQLRARARNTRTTMESIARKIVEAHKIMGVEIPHVPASAGN